MADLTYNTTDPQYVQYKNAIPGYIDYMKPILAKFKLVWFQNRTKAKAWVKKDPLLKMTLMMLLDGEQYLEKLRGEDLDAW